MVTSSDISTDIYESGDDPQSSRNSLPACTHTHRDGFLEARLSNPESLTNLTLEVFLLFRLFSDQEIFEPLRH